MKRLHIFNTLALICPLYLIWGTTGGGNYIAAVGWGCATLVWVAMWIEEIRHNKLKADVVELIEEMKRHGVC